MHHPLRTDVLVTPSIVLVLVAAFVTAPTVQAAPTEAQKCMSAKLKSLSKYDLCVFKMEAIAAASGQTGDISLCESKFAEQWTKPDAKYGADCPDATSAQVQSEVHGHLDAIRALLGIGGCNVFTQTCPAGEGCYLVTASSTGACQAAGGGVEGATCGAQNDCVPGYACIDDGISNSCRELCQYPEGPQCGAGTTCNLLIGLSDIGACL